MLLHSKGGCQSRKYSADRTGKKNGHPYIGENETLKRQRPLTEKEKIDKYKFEFIKIKFLPIKVFFHLENGKEVKIGRRYLQDIILTKG